MIHVVSLSGIHLIDAFLLSFFFCLFWEQMDRIHCKKEGTHFFKLSIVLLSMHAQIIHHSFQVVLHIPVFSHRLCTPVMLQFLKLLLHSVTCMFIDLQKQHFGSEWVG